MIQLAMGDLELQQELPQLYDFSIAFLISFFWLLISNVLKFAYIEIEVFTLANFLQNLIAERRICC